MSKDLNSFKSPTRKQFSDLHEAACLSAEWPYRQTDRADSATRFIYRCTTLLDLRRECDAQGLNDELTAYALSRWTRLKRHDAWLARFVEEPGIEAVGNARDKKRDFELAGRSFDLKVTRYPRSLRRSTSSRDIAAWMYRNQSKEGRFHLENRIFVVAENERDLYRYSVADSAVAAFCSDPAGHLFEVEVGASSIVQTAVLSV